MNNNGQDYTTSDPNITLSGTAPVDAAFLRVNGTNPPTTWTTVTNWSINLVLGTGENQITVQGYGRTNNLLPTNVATIKITYQ